MTSSPIRLLVSVRDADEAMHAIAGGADIVDVKEPLNGSLGRASAESLNLISRRLQNVAMSLKESAGANGSWLPPKLALSVALGEVSEWLENGGATQQTYDSVLMNLQPQFLKVGLAGLAQSGPEWTASWNNVRARFRGAHQWVAVAYADHVRANAPEPFAVFNAAKKTSCSVLLIDTFEKDGSTLLDWLTHCELQSLRVATQKAGIQLALAGRITEQELPQLLRVHPDIVAVRGAVCAGGERRSTVDPGRVRAFATALR